MCVCVCVCVCIVCACVFVFVCVCVLCGDVVCACEYACVLKKIKIFSDVYMYIYKKNNKRFIYKLLQEQHNSLRHSIPVFVS